MSLELPKRSELNRPLTVEEFDSIVDAVMQNNKKIENLLHAFGTEPEIELINLLKSQTDGDNTTVSGADIEVQCGVESLTLITGDTSTITTTLDNVNITLDVEVPDVTEPRRQMFIFKRVIDCSKDTMNDKAIANGITLNINNIDNIIDTSSLVELVDFYKKSDKAIKDETNSTTTINYIVTVEAIVARDDDEGKKYLMFKASSSILPASPEGLTINTNTDSE